jgi:UDP-N-acetylmuramate: L-alanyl-gamma-D-glutamyl-meso-diaminopimelate ligase
MNEEALRAYQPEPVDASSIEHVHLIAVAGTGMGTLAGMLKKAGYRVSGSDQGIYPPMSTQLDAWGIKTKEGFRAANLEPRPDLVIVGNACRPSNPEVQAAIEMGIPCTSMPRAVHDFFLKDRDVVVVAGTHGKTTTTALSGWVLESCGLQPGVLVGGVCTNFDGSFRLPQARHFVIEGDEYDSALFDKVPKFTHYAPHVGILTSVEFDHADIYDDFEAVKQAFRRLPELIPADGLLLVCGDYPAAVAIAEKASAPVMTYGLSSAYDLYGENLEWSEEGVSFDIVRRGESVGRFLLPMFGEYNVTNAIAAIGVALHLGQSPEAIQEGLRSFKGIRRRQDIAAEVGDIIVIDDFAHHPTAIKATTEAIRKRFANRRIWGIFEPRSNTARRNHFQEQLPTSFDACDQAVLGWPYRNDKLDPTERLDMPAVIETIQSRGVDAVAFHTTEDIRAYLTARARPDDVFVIMSNGSFDGLIPNLIASLRARFAATDM